VIFFFQVEDGIRGRDVTGVQTCALGTTGVAAKSTGRRFIGMEINEEYYEISKQRIEVFSVESEAESTL